MASILVCDDVRSICEMLEITLRKDGHRVETVTSGEAAKRKLDAALFDLSPDYHPALPGVHGGYDLTKPDTLANRVQSYWEEITRWARVFFP